MPLTNCWHLPNSLLPYMHIRSSNASHTSRSSPTMLTNCHRVSTHTTTVFLTFSFMRSSRKNKSWRASTNMNRFELVSSNMCSNDAHMLVKMYKALYKPHKQCRVESWSKISMCGWPFVEMEKEVNLMFSVYGFWRWQFANDGFSVYELGQWRFATFLPRKKGCLGFEADNFDMIFADLGWLIFLQK